MRDSARAMILPLALAQFICSYAATNMNVAISAIAKDLTSSVNVVQSSFPETDQGDISGLSRSVSNLGSSFGTALVGSVLVAVALPEGKPFAVAMVMMIVFTLIGLVLGVLIPRQPVETARPAESSTTAAR